MPEEASRLFSFGRAFAIIYTVARGVFCRVRRWGIMVRRVENTMGRGKTAVGAGVRTVWRHVVRHKMAYIFAVVSILLAGYYTAVSYPGIFFTDTILRWTTVIDQILYNAEGEIFLNVVPSLFMLVLYKITGSYASLTLLQSFAYFFTSFLLLGKLLKRFWYLAPLLLLNPLTLGYSVLGDMGIGCLVGINCGVLLCMEIAPQRQISTGKAVLYLALMVGASFVAFGFRQNAFTVFPVLVVFALVCYKRDRQKKKTVALLGGALAGLALVLVVPQLFDARVLNTAAPGFTWEILSTINRLPEEKQERYQDYLDDIGGPGSTRESLAIDRERDSVVGWVFSTMPYNKIGAPENRGALMEKYFQLMLREPGAFFANKVSFIGRALGIQKPLYNMAFEYKINNDMYNMGFTDSARRQQFVDHVNGFLDGFVVLRMPFVWFLAAGMVSAYRWATQKSKTELALYAVAVFYYGAFFINAQSFEFRYFFPAFQLLYCICVAGVVQGVSGVYRRLKKPRDGAKEEKKQVPAG